MRRNCKECKTTFNITEQEESYIYFCEKCRKNRCKHCQIILSKNNVCSCGKLHGYPSTKKKGYCVKCVNDEREQSKLKVIELNHALS